MNELKHNDTISSRQHDDDGAPRHSKLATGGALALMLASLFLMLLFRAPQIVWAILLAAALIMLAVAIAIGFRQWARGRIGKASSNGGTSTRRRLTDIRSRIWQSPRGDDRPY